MKKDAHGARSIDVFNSYFLSIFTITSGLSLRWNVLLWGLRPLTEESFDEALEFCPFLLDSQAVFEYELLVLQDFSPSFH